jgi:hypothetical protein
VGCRQHSRSLGRLTGPAKPSSLPVTLQWYAIGRREPKVGQHCRRLGRRRRDLKDQDCGCSLGCSCSFSRLRRMKPTTCGGKPSCIEITPEKDPALGGKRGRFREARASLRIINARRPKRFPGKSETAPGRGVIFYRQLQPAGKTTTPPERSIFARRRRVITGPSNPPAPICLGWR